MRWPPIDVVGLGKSYGTVNALVDVSLRVRAGTVLGILGHNGAGKSTLIDILATRTRPSTGVARVCGWDVTRFGHNVRRRIGMTGQFVALDETTSGQRNLVLLARLLGASRKQARSRATELIEAFGLTEAAQRQVATYSGGMRRRLDLAASLLGRPDVLFLDEPTTGLDPMSRGELWVSVEKLAAEGTTVLLTTQYLEEADRLAHEIVVLAGGYVVASGTPRQLKADVGERTATVNFADQYATQAAVAVLARANLSALPDHGKHTVMVPVRTAGDIVTVVRVLDSARIAVLDLTVTEPTLDDVYVSLHRKAWNAG